MENPAMSGAPCHASRLDTPDDTRKTHDPQAAGHAIPTDLSLILRCRLDLPDRTRFLRRAL